MSTAAINTGVEARLEEVRSALGREITGSGDVCVTCSFQAEDMLLTRLALDLDPTIPVLFLDTGYHFRETYAYRDRMAHEWKMNLINLLPEQTVARPMLQAAQGRAAFQGCGELPRLGHRTSTRAGEEPRGPRRVGDVCASRRQAGTQACSSGLVDHARRLVRLRATRYSSAAALRARLLLNRLRAMYDASDRPKRPAFRALGRAEGRMRHSHRGRPAVSGRQDKTLGKTEERQCTTSSDL